MTRNVKIQIIRGILANMPTLGDGEFYFATDKGQLYVGLNSLAYKIGGTSMANVVVQGNANPSNYVEPASDGSLAVSLGTAAGKSLVMKTASLSTSAVSNVDITSYVAGATLTGGTLFLQYIDFQFHLATLSATATLLGDMYLQLSGVPVYVSYCINPTTSDLGGQAVRLVFSEPLPIANGVLMEFKVNSLVATPTNWYVNFGGYEKIPL